MTALIDMRSLMNAQDRENTGIAVFDSEFQPLVAAAFAGTRDAELVAVLRQETDGSVLVGVPFNPRNYIADFSQPKGSPCFGGLFTYWVEETDLTKWSAPEYGPVLAPKFDETELAVCVVCIHLLANGEYDDGTDAAERAGEGMASIWGDDARHLVAGGDELGYSTRVVRGMR